MALTSKMAVLQYRPDRVAGEAGPKGVFPTKQQSLYKYNMLYAFAKQHMYMLIAGTAKTDAKPPNQRNPHCTALHIKLQHGTAPLCIINRLYKQS